jgi:hypothetical protein
MAAILEKQLELLDLSPTLKDVGIVYGVVKRRSDAFPETPVTIASVSRAKLGRYLAKIDMTFGNKMKAKLVENFKELVCYKYRQKQNPGGGE